MLIVIGFVNYIYKCNCIDFNVETSVTSTPSRESSGTGSKSCNVIACTPIRKSITLAETCRDGN